MVRDLLELGRVHGEESLELVHLLEQVLGNIGKRAWCTGQQAATWREHASENLASTAWLTAWCAAGRATGLRAAIERAAMVVVGAHLGTGSKADVREGLVGLPRLAGRRRRLAPRRPGRRGRNHHGGGVGGGEARQRNVKRRLGQMSHVQIYRGQMGTILRCCRKKEWQCECECECEAKAQSKAYNM